MSLTRNQVRDCVIKAFHEVLGEEDVERIDEGTNPFKDLGMESIDGIEYACVLSEKLNCKIPEALNPFVDDSRCQARSVSQIIDFMCGLLVKTKEAING